MKEDRYSKYVRESQEKYREFLRNQSINNKNNDSRQIEEEYKRSKMGTHMFFCDIPLGWSVEFKGVRGFVDVFDEVKIIEPYDRKENKIMEPKAMEKVLVREEPWI